MECFTRSPPPPLRPRTRTIGYSSSTGCSQRRAGSFLVYRGGCNQIGVFYYMTMHLSTRQRRMPSSAQTASFVFVFHRMVQTLNRLRRCVVSSCTSLRRRTTRMAGCPRRFYTQLHCQSWLPKTLRLTLGTVCWRLFETFQSCVGLVGRGRVSLHLCLTFGSNGSNGTIH